MEHELGKRVPNSIIICVVEQYLKEKNKMGYDFIWSVIDAVFDDVIKSRPGEIPNDAREALKRDVYADVVLNGFTRVSLLPTHHVNMLDVCKLVSGIVRAHPSLQSVATQTNTP